MYVHIIIYQNIIFSCIAVSPTSTTTITATTATTTATTTTTTTTTAANTSPANATTTTTATITTTTTANTTINTNTNVNNNTAVILPKPVSNITDSLITTTIVATKFNDLTTYNTQSASNNSFTMTATSNPSTSNGSNNKALFIIIGVLISLLIGSVIIFCSVLCGYRLKRYRNIRANFQTSKNFTGFCSTGKYPNIRFLKMNQTIKMVKLDLYIANIKSS